MTGLVGHTIADQKQKNRGNVKPTASMKVMNVRNAARYQTKIRFCPPFISSKTAGKVFTSGVIGIDTVLIG